MAYVIELDIDSFGYLTGGGEYIDVDETAKHDWLRPYPVITHDLRFEWTCGDSQVKPDLFKHNLLRDFVVTARTLEVLDRVASGDLRRIASGRLGGEILTVVQAVSVLDVVDVGKSVGSKFSWGGIAFPHIPADAEKLAARRVFRVPNVGMNLSVFVGEDVRRALIENGIQGIGFVAARVEAE